MLRKLFLEFGIVARPEHHNKLLVWDLLRDGKRIAFRLTTGEAYEFLAQIKNS